MSKQTAVRLPDEIFDRLQALAAKTGRMTTFYIREAIQEHLDDLEDLYMAEQAIERLSRGESRLVDAEEFWRGLDD
jgi:RHH-type rel operon transcriptional repressor/antitoxin RelB